MRNWIVKENIYACHLEYELNCLSASGWIVFSIKNWTALYTIICYRDE